MYRQPGESARCDACGGSDIHTLSCHTQTEQHRRDAARQAAERGKGK